MFYATVFFIPKTSLHSPIYHLATRHGAITAQM